MWSGYSLSHTILMPSLRLGLLLAFSSLQVQACRLRDYLPVGGRSGPAGIPTRAFYRSEVCLETFLVTCDLSSDVQCASDVEWRESLLRTISSERNLSKLR